jgi:hypothetical protein
MERTPEMQATVNRALDELRKNLDAPSDYAAVKRLRALGLRTSTHAFFRWRHGRWNDNDLVLITALIAQKVEASALSK